MELHQDDYIVGFARVEKNNLDSWHMIIKKTKDNKWIGEAVFRYKKDNKAFDSDDEKSIYKLKYPAEFTEVEILSELRRAQELILNDPFVRDEILASDFIIVQGHPDKFMELIKNKPWCHYKEVQKDGE